MRGGPQVPAAELRMPVSELKLYAARSYGFAEAADELSEERVGEILQGTNKQPLTRPTAMSWFKRRVGLLRLGEAKRNELSRRSGAKGRVTLSTLLSFEEVLDVLMSITRDKHLKHVVPIFPFDPETPMKQCWDCFIMMCLLYTAFAVPYFLAFGSWAQTIHPETGEIVHLSHDYSAMGIFDLSLDIVFCVDIVLNFCTAFTSRGVYITSMTEISKNYLKTWFAVDFFGSVPFDKIFSAFLDDNSDESLQDTLQSLRMIRILKTVRAVRFYQKLDHLQHRDTSGMMRGVLAMVRALFVMIFVAHFLACAMYVMVEENRGNNWMVYYDPSLLDLDRSGSNERYVTAFYWAVTTISTIGYGDILPTNHSERILVLIAGLVGGVAFAFSLGNITAIISDSSDVSKQFEKDLSQLKQYLEFRVTDREVKRRALSYYGSCWRVSGRAFREADLLKQLPLDIRNDLIERVGFEMRGKIFFLHGLEDRLLGDIFMRLIPNFFQDRDVIFKAMDEGHDAFFLELGHVHLDRVQLQIPFDHNLDDAAASNLGKTRYSNLAVVTSTSRGQYFGAGGGQEGDDDNSTAELDAHSADAGEIVPRGEAFGEVCLFPDICKYRYETATAKGNVRVLMLGVDAFTELQQLHPPFALKMREMCELNAAILGISNDTLQEAKMSLNEHSYLASTVAKTKLKFTKYHEHDLFKGMSIPCFDVASKRQTESSRTGEIFRGWLRVESPKKMDSLYGFKTGNRTLFETHANHNCNTSHIWEKVSIGISEAGDVMAMFDTIQDLVMNGHQNLGRLMLHSGKACIAEALAHPDLIVGLRVVACTFAVSPPPQFSKNDLASKSHSKLDGAHERSPILLTIGVSSPDAKRLCLLLEQNLQAQNSTPFGVRSDKMEIHGSTVGDEPAQSGDEATQESPKGIEDGVPALLRVLRLMRQEMRIQNAAIQDLQSEVRALGRQSEGVLGPATLSSKDRSSAAEAWTIGSLRTVLSDVASRAVEAVPFTARSPGFERDLRSSSGIETTFSRDALATETSRGQDRLQGALRSSKTRAKRNAKGHHGLYKASDASESESAFQEMPSGARSTARAKLDPATSAANGRTMEWPVHSQHDTPLLEIRGSDTRERPVPRRHSRRQGGTGPMLSKELALDVEHESDSTLLN